MTYIYYSELVYYVKSEKRGYMNVIVLDKDVRL